MTRAELSASPHALYRFLGEQGALLYVGITNNPGRRFAQHSSGREWWHEVAEIRIERFSDREAALAAERQAIRTERPRYNVAHRVDGTEATESAIAGTDSGAYPVSVDECVALGLVDSADVDRPDGRDCPVGLVKSVGPWGVRLSLMSFWSGEFGHATAVVPWHRIAEVRVAALEHEGTEDYDLGKALGATVIYDTKPLGDFQTIWCSGREQLSKLKHE